jgi:hypothetical protein
METAHVALTQQPLDPLMHCSVREVHPAGESHERLTRVVPQARKKLAIYLVQRALSRRVLTGIRHERPSLSVMQTNHRLRRAIGDMYQESATIFRYSVASSSNLT